MLSSRLAAMGAISTRASAIPAWRMVSSTAASRALRSGSSSPPSAGSDRPIPSPARSWGGKVHSGLAPGSHASASTPAPTSRQPAAERETASPRATRDPIKAPAGSAVTAAAAASGARFQPATSSRMSRNSTPVRAAETSARASAGPVSGSRTRRSLPLAGRGGGGHACARTDEGEWRLNDEYRAPVEGLGERATQRGANCGPEHRSPDPQLALRYSVRVQEREGGHQTAGSSNCLQGAAHEEGGHIVRPGAHERCRREEREPGDAHGPVSADLRHTPSAHQRETQNQCVDADHRRHALDRGVELGEQVGECQRDDRGVGQRQPGGGRKGDGARPHACMLPGSEADEQDGTRRSCCGILRGLVQIITRTPVSDPGTVVAAARWHQSVDPTDRAG